MPPLPLRSTSRGDPPSFFLNRLVATVERPGWCLIRCSVQQSLTQMIPRHLFLNLIFFFWGKIIGALEFEIRCGCVPRATKTTRQALVDFVLREAPSNKTMWSFPVRIDELLPTYMTSSLFQHHEFFAISHNCSKGSSTKRTESTLFTAQLLDSDL